MNPLDERIRAMAASGMSRAEICGALGLRSDRVRWALDPEFRDRKRRQTRERARRVYKTGKIDHGGIVSPALRADAERLMAEIPPDTRGPNARLMGDPIFERSALYAKRRRATGA